jgi:AsmA protein
MGKLLRVLGAIIGVLVLLIIVAVIVLPLIIDPNDYKDEIAKAVREQTGRELTIAGDIDLSVFPWLGMDMGSTRLSNAPGFGDQPFAAVEAVQVRLKLLPLLRKQIEMDTVVLKGLRLNLAKNEQGVTNWDDLTAATPEAPPAEEKPEPGEIALAGLAIGGVKVTDGQVVWEDQTTGARYSVEDFSLLSGAIQPGQPVAVNLGLQLNANQPPMTGKVDFDGSVWVSESLQQFKLSEAVLAVDLLGESLPAGALEAKLATDVSVDLEQQTLSMPELVLEALGLKVTGQFSGQELQGDNPLFTGTLRLHEFVPRTLVEKLGMELPPMADATVLGKADGQLALDASLDHVAVDKLQLRLDDSQITGRAGVRDFAAPAIRFDLTLDAIDVDRYLPPPSEGETPAAAPPTAAAAAGAAELPLETLRALDVDGSFRIGELKAFQLRSTDVLITLKAKDGVMRVHPAQAKLYQGLYNGDLTFDVRQDTPRLAMNEKLAGIQAAPLLQDLTGKDTLHGMGNVEAKLNARGIEPEQVRRTLNGTLAFSFTDGMVKGVDIAGLIQKANALLKGQPAPTDTGANETRFTELTGTANVVNGLVSNNDLSAKTPFLRINGDGTAHLAEETIDYLVKAKVVASPEGQGGKSLEELKGLTIPVRVKGTLAEPKYSVELDQVLKDAAKKEVQQQVDKQKEKLQEKLQDQLDDQLGDKLKGLFR